MANLMRNQPREVVSLREAMDRMFDDSFLKPFGEGGFANMAVPAVDMAETDSDVIVTATVPGIKAENLQITVTGDMLQLSGEMQAETEKKEATYHIRERRSGAFKRSIPLPASVVADNARAEFDNGVLTLTLPKEQKARRKTVNVQTKR